MDPLYQVISLYRRRHYEKCVELTTHLLEINPNDQVRLNVLVVIQNLEKNMTLIIENFR